MKDSEHLEKATFAGGCFWCMQPPFENLEGVISVISGYSGGTKENPSYKEVLTGDTGHAEAVQITYDKRKINYAQLLDVFWRQIDPTTANQQFADRGSQYRTAIFYHTEEQKQLAEASKAAMEESGIFGAPIITEIEPFSNFFPAEEYHQDYHKKEPVHYQLYRSGSGRDHYLKTLWKKKS